MNVGVSVPLPAYLVDAGADRVVVRPPTASTEAEMRTGLAHIAEAVLR